MVQQQLSTPQGFARAVNAKRGVFIAAIACLIVGLFCLGMNTYQLGSASGWDWSLMGRYFFDANAISFTGGRSGRSEMWRFIYVFAPLVVIPAGIVLFIIHLMTRGNATAGLFSDFQSRGWVGRQREVGLKVKNGNVLANVSFVSHPSIPDDVFQGAVQHYTSFVTGLDKKALKDASGTAAKAGVLTGTDASTLMPGAPAGLIAAVIKGKGEYVVVVPPAPGAKGKMRVLDVKPSAITPTVNV